MTHTYDAVIDEEGNIELVEPVSLSRARRALVIVLDDEPITVTGESALLSEPALRDWERPEEVEAWSHLQPGI